MDPRDDDEERPREPAWRRYLRFHRDDVDADVRDEIAFHIEGVVEELRARGMAEDEARRAARERFGDLPHIEHAMRTLAARRKSAATRIEWIRGIRQDLVYSARGVRRSPFIAAAIILTLALGLGTAAAVFSLLDQLYWRPPAGVEEPGELRRVWTRELQRWDNTRPARPTISYPRYRLIAEAFGDRVDFGLYMRDTTVRLGRDPHGPRVSVSLANRDYFRVLGVRISHGRLWDEDEDRVTAPSPLAIVSARFAEGHLGGATAAVGSDVELGGRTFTVVGVAAPPFAGTELSPIDVWAPLGEYMARFRPPGVRVWYDQPTFGSLRAVARLTEDADPGALEALGTTRLRAAQPELLRGYGDSLITMHLGSIIGVRGPGEVAEEVSVASRLGILAAIMLVIACANVANLLLARAVRRRRELVLRVAIGASRARLMRLLTVESLLLGIPAGIAAIIAATWAGGVLQARLLPDVIGTEPELHWRVVAFAMMAAFAASWLTGIVPALQASRADPGEALKAGGRSSTAGTSRVRFALTTAQLALSVALLAAAGSFLASLRHLRALDLGVDTERIVIASVEYDDRRAEPEGTVIASALAEAGEMVRRLPGVEATAMSATRPMDGSWIYMQFFAGGDSLQSSGAESDRWPVLFLVSADYFRTMGMRFVRGRPFEADEPPAVVVNETMARMLWPGLDPLTQCMHVERRSSPCRPVAGVVADARRSEIVEEARPQYYAPLALKADDGWTASALVVRVAPDRRGAATAALRDRLAQQFPAAIPNVISLEDALAPQLRPWRLGAELFTVLALLGLTLSVIGVYGTVAYEVSQRTREFGVRIALGARTPDILRAVARNGMRPVVAGTIVGIALAIATGRLIASLLHGTSPYDPGLLTGVIALLVAVSAIAMAGPALRARRVDPVAVLRSE